MQRITKLFMAMVMLTAVLTACGDGAGNDSAGNSNASTSANAADGASSQNEGAAGENTKDEVTVRVEATWSSFNPLKANMYVEMFEINQMYEALTYVDDDAVVIPVLAESWTVSDDGKTYVFQIRDGVKFHNGQDLKASDVAFTLMEGKNFTQLNTYLDPVLNAEATDDLECTVTLSKPFSPFVSFLENVRIVNEQFYTENDGKIDTISCGTGPYMLVGDLDMNTHCTMEAFPDYWKGEASIKKINFTIIPDDTTAAVAYMAGEIDFLMTAASQYLEISSQPDLYEFTNIPTKHTLLFYMNHDLEMFSDVRVRKAMNHAINTDIMIQVAFEGYAVPAYLQGDESCFGINYDYAVKYDYDLDKAVELLTEAGYPPGTHLGKIYSNPGSYFDKCAVVFQSSLEEAGYGLEIVGMDTTASTAEAIAGNFEFMIGGQSFSTDFAYASRQYSTSGIGGGNYARYSNPVVDENFALAEGESDPAVREQLYGEIIQIVTEDAVDMPIFHKNLLFAWKKGLDCVVHPDSGKPYYVYEWSW